MTALTCPAKAQITALRKIVKACYPGVRVSVRKGTGTCAYLVMVRAFDTRYSGVAHRTFTDRATEIGLVDYQGKSLADHTVHERCAQYGTWNVDFNLCVLG